MSATISRLAPRNVNRSVRQPMPTRPANADLRTREYLTPAEVEKLIREARKGRWGHRDSDSGPHHLSARPAGNRAVRSRMVANRIWPNRDLARSSRQERDACVHPLRGDEVRALRELRRETQGGFVFETERGGPFTTDAVNRLIKRIAERAGFDFSVHIHMLRHACGFALANKGHDTRAIQDWLGHRSIQHTVPIRP